MQEPSRVERLLERIVTQAQLVPVGAYQLRDPGKLPSVLQQVLAELGSGEWVWTCWADGSRIWLFIAEMSLMLSQQRGAPVLMLKVYGERGNLEESGHWTIDPEGNWRRTTE